MTDSQSVWQLFKSRHRVALTVVLLSSSIIVLAGVSAGLLQNPSFSAPQKLIEMPVVPIFAALNERDGHVVFVNEADLGYQAIRRFPLPESQPENNQQIEPNTSGVITLGQPVASQPRETSLSEINLSMADVFTALLEGRDYSRVNNHHEKQLIELENGEQAVWISVPHFGRYLRYSSGLLYTIRQGRPEILFQLSAAHEFFLSDFDQDGFQDIARVVDKSFAWTHWDYYRFDVEKGYFVKAPASWHWFPLRYTVQEIKVLFALCLPLLVTLSAAIWLRRHWFPLIVNVLAQLYLLFAVLSIGVIATINFVPFTWAVLISFTMIGLMRLSRVLVRKPADAGEPQSS